MENLTRLSRSMIRLGEPIPYPVYDSRGTLLLQAGCTIQKQSHLDTLTERGLYHDHHADRARRTTKPLPKPEEPNTFEALELLKVRLKRLLHNLVLDQGGGHFVPGVEDIAATLMGICAQSNSAPLACLQLDHHSSYGVVHHLKTAILCELVGKKLGFDETSRRALMRAALTHDLGLIDIQDILDKRIEPLTEEQAERIRSHPADSCRLLERHGVRDSIWLDAVLHHHERIDGSGYPDHLAKLAVTLPARVLATADVFSAMIRERPHRKARPPQDAMRAIMVEEGAKIDQQIVRAMVREIGMFPPGSIVKLATGEIGVVKLPTEHIACPIVYSFVKPNGTPMLTPIRRDTSNSEHSVSGLVPFLEYRSSISLIRGLWC